MKLHFKEYGTKGPVLVILHGLFGELANWQPLATKFGQYFRVYSVDQRNHGKSPHSDEFTYEAMADDLKELIVDLSLEHVHLLGHSMGAKTAMFFAVSNPHMVDRLIVVDMAPKAYNSGFEDIYEALLGLPIDAFKGRQEADKELSKKISSTPLRQFLLMNLERKPEGGFRWQMNLEVIVREHKNILKAVPYKHPFERPVLFIRGGASPYIKVQDFAESTKLFPDAQFKTIEGAGHWVHADAPTDLFAMVMDFLQN